MISENDRHYISLLHENINRMAGNSANCKTWLVTLVAAITALQLTADDLRNILWIAPGLIILFYCLDSYYLSLERKFIALEKEFVAKAKTTAAGVLNEGIYTFDIKNVKEKRATFWSSLVSWSTLPFYICLLLVALGICLWPIIAKTCCCG